MKKIITLLFFFIYLISNAQYVTVRKPLRIVYDNDTLDIYFDEDTVNFHSNLNFHKFENGAIIADSIFVNGNWYKDFKIDSSSVTYSLDTLFLYEDKTYITKDPTTNFGIKLRSDWGGAFDSSVINFKLSNSFIGIQDKYNNYIQFDNLGITFTRGGSYLYDGTYFRSLTDTLADMDWVRNNTGGGDVYKVGTPVDNQLGIWTGDGTIEGNASLTYDGTVLGLGSDDYINFSGSGSIYPWNEGLFFDLTSGNDIYFRGTYINTANSNGIFIRTSGSSISNPMYSNYTDQTTGVTPLSGQVSLIAGGSEGLRIETQAIIAYDTTYLDYLTPNSNRALQLTPTGGITFTDNNIVTYGNQVNQGEDLIVKINGGNGVRAEGNLVWYDTDYRLNLTGELRFGGNLSTTNSPINFQPDLSTVMRIDTDSIIAYDSIYGKYISCTEQPNWAVWDSITGALTNDSTADAGFGLTMEIPETIEEFMKDRHGNELAYYYEDNNGEIRKVYTLKRTGPGKTIQKLASRDEIIMRYVEQLEKQNKELIERLERLENVLLSKSFEYKELPTYIYDQKMNTIININDLNELYKKQILDSIYISDSCNNLFKLKDQNFGGEIYFKQILNKTK